MADTPYNSGRTLFVTQGLHWVNDTVKAVLVDTTVYTFDAAHQFLSSISAPARIATATLSGKSISAIGGCLAASPSLPGVTGAQVGAVVLYKQGASDATSTLIAYLDSLPGLPFNPSGGAVLLAFNNTAAGIFRA